MKTSLKRRLVKRFNIFVVFIGLIACFPYSSFGEIQSDREKTNPYDRFGGWKEIASKGTGFFRVEQIEGRWWFITPEGHGFISKGVNSFWYRKTMLKEDLGLLRSFGLNTIGAWAKIPGQQDELRRAGIPYVILLDLLRSYALSKGIEIKEGLPDIFTEEFAQAVQKRLEEMQKQFDNPKGSSIADDPYLIGWWPDNELRWPSEKNHILNNYMNLPSSAPGRKAAEAFLRDKFGTPVLPSEGKRLDDARDGFLEIAVRHYAKITTDAIRKYDKNHLILGSRLFFTPFAWKNTMPERMGGFEAVARGAKGYWDVISINCYFDKIPLDRTRKLYEAFQGPLLISEFNIAGTDKDQGKRGETEWEARSRISAEGFEKQIPLLMAEPYMIGYHFFPFANHRVPEKYSSHPGLVNYQYEPRGIFKKSLQKVNSKLEMLHKGDIQGIGNE